MTCRDMGKVKITWGSENYVIVILDEVYHGMEWFLSPVCFIYVNSSGPTFTCKLVQTNVTHPRLYILPGALS